MNLQEIKYKVQKGEPVTELEYAYLLRNDASAFFGFLVQNNPGQLNDILRHKLNYTELGFAPDQKAIARILDFIIDSKNGEEFNFIVENVKIDTSKISPELLEAIQSGDYVFEMQEIGTQRTAQEIAASIGSSIGSFLNPVFGSTTTTTTTAPSTPIAEKSGSKAVIIVFVFVVLVVGAIFLLKKSN